MFPFRIRHRGRRLDACRTGHAVAPSTLHSRLAVEALEPRHLLALAAGDDVFTGVVEDSGERVLDVLVNDTPNPGAALTILATSEPDQGGTVWIDGPQLFYRPAADFAGEEHFTYTVSDGIDTPVQANVRVLVDAVNDAPVIETVPSGHVSRFVVSGSELGTSFGQAVSGAGDFDGDGFDDIIAGRACRSSQQMCPGVALVLSGVDGRILHTFEGRGRDNFGYAVSSAGDVNRDGRPDVVVGAPGWGELNQGGRPGTATVYSGTDGDELFVLQGGTPTDEFGAAVSGLGDVNGDGFDDIIVGSPRDGWPVIAGSAHVFSGADSSVLYTVQGNPGEYLGGQVAGAGDVNADGLADFIVDSTVYSGADGSVLYALSGRHVRGAGDVNADGFDDLVEARLDSLTPNVVRIVSGRDGATFYSFEDDSSYGRLGFSVASAGDTNGDGFDDVLVGATDDAGAGNATLISGRDGTLLSVFPVEPSRHTFGRSMASAGDVNGDGLADIVLGSTEDSGKVWVFASTRAPKRFSLPTTVRQAAPPGDTVESLFPGLLIDADEGAASGIAVRAVTGAGSWQFSLDAGQNYSDFGDVSATQSILLRSGDRIRYVAGPFDSETVSLELVGWDQTSGRAGEKVDTRSRGGSTAFSLESTTGFLGSLANANAKMLATGIDQSHRYTEGAPSVLLGPIEAWNDNPFGRVTATLSLANMKAGTLSADSGNGETFDRETGRWSVTGLVPQVNAALAAITFWPAAGNDQDTTVEVSIVDLQGGAMPASGAISLDVVPSNDAPVMRRLVSAEVAFSFYGSSTNDEFGAAVSGAGDVNGDGFGDFIVGAPLDDDTGKNAGSVVVVSGADRSILYTFRGDSSLDTFGRSVGAAGDVNGDGLDDVIVGAPNDDHDGQESGSAYVYSGADGSQLFAAHGGSYTAFGFSVSGVGDVNGDGFDDFVVGAPQVHDDLYAPTTARVYSGRDFSELYTLEGNDLAFGFGYSVDGAGDVNGDGLDDVIVGYPTSYEEGGAHVYSGADGSMLHHVPYPPDGPSRSFGMSVAGAGDVDGDGLADVVVGAAGENAAYVFSGRDGLHLHTFRSDSGENTQFGTFVSSGGDLNGDGFDDLIVGEPGADVAGEDAGSVHVFSGKDGALLLTLHGDSAGDRFGQSASRVGDVNGDGFPELIVGAPYDDKTGVDTGTAWLFTLSAGEPVFNLPPIRQDGPGEAHTVAELFPDLLDDPDGQALGGIAIQSATGQGTWEISVDGGRNYGPLGTVGIQRSLLLRDTDYLRYVPAPGVLETVELRFAGWDQSSGLAGQKVDTSTRGGATAFSLDSATARLDVNRVNHPPVATGLTQSFTYAEDDVEVVWDDIVVTDTDEDDTIFATLTLSDTTTGMLTADSGFGEAYDHQTGIWSMVGSVAEVNAALAEVAFRPAENNNDDSEIAVSIRDRDATDGQEITGRVALQALPVNDAPVITSRLRVLLESAPEQGFGNGLGGAISVGGDVNGDGFDDVLVGSAGLVLNWNASILVVSGFDLSTLLRIEGTWSFGSAVSILGDVNGDQRDDFIVGTSGDDGKAEVFSGANGSVLYTYLDFGDVVGAPGDVNGDGRADMLIADRTGTAHVFSGSDGSLVYEVPGGKLRSTARVSNIGDANGDGVSDFVVGQPTLNLVTIISGVDGSPWRTLDGDAPGGGFGAAVGAAGDFNGDGFADVIVGAPDARNSAGSRTGIVQILSGADGTVLQTLEGKSGGDQFGAAVSRAGDFDGDGVPDVFVGEPRADNDGVNGGSVYVLSGRDGSILFQADTRGADTLDFTRGALGTSVAATDLNRDGILDLIAGAPWNSQALVFLSPGAVALPEGEVTNASGAAITDVLASRFIDIDSPAIGAAIRAAGGRGTWQFSLDGGATFEDIGTPDESRSLLLRPSDRLRYVSAAGESGTASLELVGWDQSSGVAGSRVDTSLRGGSTAFAFDSVTGYLHLAEQNHPPTATNLDQVVTYVEGDASVPLGDIVVTEIDAGDEVSVTLTLADRATGRLSAGSNHGEQYDETTGAWTMTGSIGQVNAALAAVEFLPSVENDQDTIVGVTIADGGENDAPTLSGGMILDVTPVNDAPVLRTFDVRTIHGDADDVSFGRSVAAAGDVNGDGYADFIVEASRYTVRSGRAVVYSGVDNSVLHEFRGALGEQSVRPAGDVNGDGSADLFFATGSEVRLISGVDGTTLYSIPSRGGVQSVGDVNGDGYDDFVSGVRPNLHSGQDGSVLEPDLYTKIGNYSSLVGIGDVNGDGFGDVAIGENSLWRTSRVLSGADLSLLFLLPGDSPSDYLGAGISGAGDVNADGVPDVAALGGTNYVRVFSGVDGSVLFDLRGDESLGRFVPSGGGGVAGGGDVNGDGFADVLVASSHGSGSARLVHVFSGADGSVLYSLEGDSPDDVFGSDIAVAGDVNGDGLDDIIVGAPFIFNGPGFASVYMPIGVWNVDPGPIDRPTIGEAVSELFPDLLFDVDTGAQQGIAIRSTMGDGSWQFSLDGGQTFQDVGLVEPSQSLLLRSSDRLRYVIRHPSAHGPTASFRFVGWDQSDGGPGAKVDSSVTGGSSAFSSESSTALMRVDPDQTLDPRLVAGDANRDFQFDRQDYLQLFQSGKYLSGEEAFWAGGDFNGDLRFDQLDIVAALQTNTYLHGRYTD